jgi:hypothetical protein
MRFGRREGGEVFVDDMIQAQILRHLLLDWPASQARGAGGQRRRELQASYSSGCAQVLVLLTGDGNANGMHGPNDDSGTSFPQCCELALMKRQPPARAARAALWADGRPSGGRALRQAGTWRCGRGGRA